MQEKIDKVYFYIIILAQLSTGAEANPLLNKLFCFKIISQFHRSKVAPIFSNIFRSKFFKLNGELTW